jgi:pSer/pThr/pTyr-binding forkhead associated (FHA) protein
MRSTELSTQRPNTIVLPETDLAELAALELAALDLDDLEAEVDEVVGRADTFVMGIEENGQADNYYARKPAPKYLQGVIAGTQIYLISNLSGSGSTSLFQPQLVWTLGRNREAGVPIKDKMMSRRHATVIYLPEENAFYLLDLNSMNGSYVNGVRVQQRQQLADGDFLRVGNTEFFFFVSQQQETLEPLHPEVHGKFMNFACQTLWSEVDAAG